MESLLHTHRLTSSAEEYKTSIKLLHTYVKNIVNNPTVDKYRKLKIENEKFNKNIWRFEACRTLLLVNGFEQTSEYVSAPAGCELSHLLSLLEKEMPSASPLSQVASPSTAASKSTPSLKLSSQQQGSMFVDAPKADLTLLSYLVQMGYDHHAAEKGLIATGNKGVQPAMDWIVEHPECLVPQSTCADVDMSSSPDLIRSPAATDSTSAELSEASPAISSRLQKANDEKHKYQEKLRLQAITKAKQEKAADKKALEYLKRNLQSERLESKQKFEQEKIVRHASAEPNTVDTASQPHSSDVSKIRIKLLKGDTVLWETSKLTSVSNLCSHVVSLTGLPSEDLLVVVPHPHEILGMSDETTLVEKGLYPTATVAVQTIKNPSVVNETSDALTNEVQSDEQKTLTGDADHSLMETELVLENS